MTSLKKISIIATLNKIYSRSLFVPDFAKWFFVRYTQIYEAYVERTLIKFVYRWRKNSRKSGCKGDSESTLNCKGEYYV